MEEEKKIMESLEDDSQEKSFPEEGKKELTKPISEEEFKEKAKQMAENNYNQVMSDFFDHKPGEEILHLRDYSGVKKFKSIRRAIRKGYVSVFGDVYPKRPFKNIKSKKGNITYMKKRLYEQAHHKNRKIA
jgi:hypothetical protein